MILISFLTTLFTTKVKRAAEDYCMSCQKANEGPDKYADQSGSVKSISQSKCPSFNPPREQSPTYRFKRNGKRLKSFYVPLELIRFFVLKWIG